MTYHVEFDIDFKRNTYPGKLIAIEGNDGSGKTTQVERIAEELKKSGKKVFVTKNPTDGPIGKFIREVLSGELKLPTVSFQYLFTADRQTQQVEIIEHLKAGEIVITDRYFWSALAYGMVDQGVVSEKAGKMILVSQGILSMYHQFLIPDYTFYLKINSETAVNRLSSMDKKKEIYEEEKKLAEINKAYEWLVSQFPKEIIVVDGEKSVEEVTNDIRSQIAS